MTCSCGWEADRALGEPAFQEHLRAVRVNQAAVRAQLFLSLTLLVVLLLGGWAVCYIIDHHDKRAVAAREAYRECYPKIQAMRIPNEDRARFLAEAERHRDEPLALAKIYSDAADLQTRLDAAQVHETLVKLKKASDAWVQATAGRAK